MSTTHLVDRVVLIDPGQIVEAEVVVGRRVLAPVGLEQADRVGAEVAPPAELRPVRLDVVSEVVVGADVRHRQIARAGCRRASGCRSSPGSRRARAARGSRRRAARCFRAGAARSTAVRIVLHTDGVLRPADRITERARPLATRVVAERLGDRDELLHRAAAGVRNELWRVAREVPLEHLEHTARDAASVGSSFGRLAGAHSGAAVRHGRPRAP